MADNAITRPDNVSSVRGRDKSIGPFEQRAAVAISVNISAMQTVPKFVQVARGAAQ